MRKERLTRRFSRPRLRSSLEVGMGHYTTVMGSLESFERGHLSIIDDDHKHYCYSNVFEVASKSRPYDKVAVAKNLDYVIEAIRAEGTSDWFAASYDEFVVAM